MACSCFSLFGFATLLDQKGHACQLTAAGTAPADRMGNGAACLDAHECEQGEGACGNASRAVPDAEATELTEATDDVTIGEPYAPPFSSWQVSRVTHSPGANS